MAAMNAFASNTLSARTASACSLFCGFAARGYDVAQLAPFNAQEFEQNCFVALKFLPEEVAQDAPVLERSRVLAG
jgi:hypothetical protein